MEDFEILVSLYEGRSGLKDMTQREMLEKFAKVHNETELKSTISFASNFKRVMRSAGTLKVEPKLQAMPTPSKKNSDIINEMNKRNIRTLNKMIVFPKNSTTFTTLPMDISAKDNIVSFMKMGNPDSKLTGVFMFSAGRHNKILNTTIPELDTFSFDGVTNYDTTAKEKRVVSYYPSYKNHNYSKYVPRKMRTIMTNGKISLSDVQSAKATWDAMMTFASENFYGNGSPAGQMGRLASVHAVRASSKGVTLPVNKMTAAFSYIMMRFFTRKENAGLPVLDTPNIQKILTGTYISDHSTGERSSIKIKLNMKANAGPVYKRGTKRVSTYFQDIKHATKMLLDISKVGGKAWLKDNQHARCVYLMNKAEVYTMEEFTTKTRNIAVYSTPYMLPALIFIQNWAKHLQNFTEDPMFYRKGEPIGSHCLNMIGTSFDSGGMHRVLQYEQRVHQGDEFFVTTYADNLYAIEKHQGKTYYASIDASKMEASVRPGYIQAMVNVMIKEYSKAGAIGNSWMTYMLDVFPVLAGEPIGILGDKQIPLEFMGSGVIGTPYFNGILMSMMISEVILNKGSLLDGPKMSKKLLEVAHKWGIVLKLEFMREFSDYVYYPGNPIRFKLMDMLGHDVAYYPVTPDIAIPVPVLNKDRLFALMLYEKSTLNNLFNSVLSDAEITNKEDQSIEVLKDFLTFIRMKVAYMKGGWADPLMSRTCRNICSSLMSRFQHAKRVGFIDRLAEDGRLSQLLDDYVVMDTDIIREGFIPAIKSIVLDESLPTVYGIFAASLPNKEKARALAETAYEHNILGLLPRDFFPLDILREKGFDTYVSEIGFKIKEMKMPKPGSEKTKPGAATPSLDIRQAKMSLGPAVGGGLRLGAKPDPPPTTPEHEAVMDGFMKRLASSIKHPHNFIHVPLPPGFSGTINHPEALGRRLFNALIASTLKVPLPLVEYNLHLFYEKRVLLPSTTKKPLEGYHFNEENLKHDIWSLPRLGWLSEG